MENTCAEALAPTQPPWGLKLLELVIHGGARLEGAVKVAGSRNACLAVMAAAVMARGETVIENAPHIGDVRVMCDILRFMGLGVRRIGSRALAVESRHTIHPEPRYDLCAELRPSSLLIGPLLARCGRARVAMPGDARIGQRPLDQHIKGLRAMGADVVVEHGYIVASADQLRSSRIYLDVPSVGATENLMMAASTATGTTTIENAALEPEVVDLANVLNLMGACVRGAGTDVVRVEGAQSLRAVSYSVIPDRVEAATLLTAAMVAGGRVRVVDVIPSHLDSVVSKCVEAGAEVDSGLDWIEMRRETPLMACNVKTLPYPGFPTDVQPMLSAVLCRAEGVSMVTESVFENRFLHVDELKRMGASMRIEGRTLIVDGPSVLTAARVRASDARSGAALLLAALAASGQSVLAGAELINGAYEGLPSKLCSLGASMSTREAASETACGEDANTWAN